MRLSISSAAQFCIGFALSTAHPVGLVAAVAMPALALRQPSRRRAYTSAARYYAGALWPLIPSARNFFGPEVSLLTAFALWAVACALLSTPWPVVWPADRRQAWWRAALGLLFGVVPPLGIVGLASPLTAAGLLFPGTAWFGLATCAIAPGLVAVWPRFAIPVLLVVAALCNATCPPVQPLPAGWIAINTRFGAIAHSPTSPLAEYHAAQRMQYAALATNAKVLLFPETVVPTWTPATDAFWQQTLDRLHIEGKTVVVGARLPVQGTGTAEPYSDLAAALNFLRDGTAAKVIMRNPTAIFAYDNAAVVRGAEEAVFRQRIPVPMAMWKPFRQGGARLHPFDTGVIRIGRRRAAILICYEQLLVWPLVLSELQHPSILLGMANDHWAPTGSIPDYQRLALYSWSRLFVLPFLSATNI